MKSVKLILIAATVLLSISAYSDTQDDLALEKQLSAGYMDKVAHEPGAKVLEQGVVIRPLFVSETQVFPHINDQVSVLYHLADRQGKLIEESLTSDELAVFPLRKLIKCWQVALPKIAVGSFYKVSCPSDTAYGDQGAGDGLIKPGAALTFRITLFATKRQQ